MTQDTQKTCSTCQGKKVVEGTCACSSEWRGVQNGDDWEDCQCTPEEECPACGGTGLEK